MNEAELMTALLKGSPLAVAILALGFSVWKWILPMLRELRQMDRAAEAQREAAQRESEAAREAARVARDTAWQASLREIGASHKEALREIGASHKEATAVAVSGFTDALDRHDRAMDRYAQQHQALAADVSTVKTDVASMRSDLHAAVARLVTLDGIPPVSVASGAKKE